MLKGVGGHAMVYIMENTMVIDRPTYEGLYLEGI